MDIKKKTKKEIYDSSLFDQRTYINGEIAIKPYYYMRNGLLHVRYTVDRCVELSKAEDTKIKVDLTSSPADKQTVLSNAWNFLTNAVGKTIIMDGIAEMEKRIKKFEEGSFRNGHQS